MVLAHGVFLEDDQARGGYPERALSSVETRATSRGEVRSNPRRDEAVHGGILSAKIGVVVAAVISFWAAGCAGMVTNYYRSNSAGRVGCAPHEVEFSDMAYTSWTATCPGGRRYYCGRRAAVGTVGTSFATTDDVVCTPADSGSAPAVAAPP
jgi:hypothetical protein